MIKRLIFLITFASTLPSVAQNLCELDSVLVEVGECSEGMVDVWLDFMPPMLHSEAFTVKGNGFNYGSFKYAELPAHLGRIEVDSKRLLEFIIQDAEIDTCVYAFEYGVIECSDSPCDIIDMTAYAIDSCLEGSTYSVWLDFVPQGFQAFDIYVNGEFHAFYHTEQLPVVIKAVKASGKDADVIKVYANDRQDCYQVKEVAAPKCPDSCAFYGVSAKAVECDEASFFVKIHLEHESAHGDSLYISGNGKNYGGFSYDQLPIFLGPFFSEEQEHLEFVVKDSKNPQCIVETIIEGSPCKPPCAITGMEADIIRCDLGTFDVQIDFSFESGISDSFRIKGNGQDYGYFSYLDLPVILTGFETNTGKAYEFLVYDRERWECHAFVEVGPVSCDCLVFDVNVASGGCTSDSTYVLELDFRTDLSDTFDLFSRGEILGTFHTSELPLRLADFPASGRSSDALMICLRQENSCCIEMEVDVPECIQRDCEISNITATLLDCQEGQYFIKLAHEGEEITSTNFGVKVSGDFLGEFKYAKLPLKIGPFEADHSEGIVLEIYETDNANCRQTHEIEAPDCACSVGEISVEVGDCTSDSTYLIELDVDMEGHFDFYINGHFCGTFDSAELPRVFEDFPASGGEHDFIKICEVNNFGCCREMKIKAPSCAVKHCGFENIRHEVSDCDSANQFFIVLDFDTVGSHSETFIVQQGEQFFEYAYGQLPVKIGPFEGGGEFYKLKICDGVWHDCHADLEVGRVICENQCDFSAATITFDQCVGDDYYILRVDSVRSSFQAFDIYYEDKGLGFYKLKDLPLRLKVPILDQDSMTLNICVSDNTTCCYPVTLAVPRCSEHSCNIANLRLDTLECRGDSLWMNFNLDAEEEGQTPFSLTVNGNEFSKFYQEELPLHIGPFPSSENAVYEIEVKSLLNPDCRLELRIDDLSCPENSLVEGNKLLILESVEKRAYVKVPDFISERTVFNLVDLNGRILHNVQFSTEFDRAVLQIPIMTAGMYLVRMRSVDGSEYITKLIIP